MDTHLALLFTLVSGCAAIAAILVVFFARGWRADACFWLAVAATAVSLSAVWHDSGTSQTAQLSTARFEPASSR